MNFSIHSRAWLDFVCEYRLFKLFKIPSNLFIVKLEDLIISTLNLTVSCEFVPYNKIRRISAGS